MTKKTWIGILAVVTLLLVANSVRTVFNVQQKWTQRPVAVQQSAPETNYKVRQEGDKTYLLASKDPSDPQAEWFDITGSPLNPDGYQYGIGKDTIPAIDDPRFLPVGDKRLLSWRIKDDTPVIGYAAADDARAYPVHLMDHHELVNDTIGGKPVTVGW